MHYNEVGTDFQEEDIVKEFRKELAEQLSTTPVLPPQAPLRQPPTIPTNQWGTSLQLPTLPTTTPMLSANRTTMSTASVPRQITNHTKRSIAYQQCGVHTFGSLHDIIIGPVFTTTIFAQYRYKPGYNRQHRPTRGYYDGTLANWGVHVPTTPTSNYGRQNNITTTNCNTTLQSSTMDLHSSRT